MPKPNQKLSIDQSQFMMAFGRDVDYHDASPQFTYLDRRTGDVIWVCQSNYDAYLDSGIPPDENREQRERIGTDPDRFLQIPGLSHGAPHEILKTFLSSNWTEDEERRQNAESAYFDSIGRWKSKVNDQNAVDAFYYFRDDRLTKLVEKFLRRTMSPQHGSESPGERECRGRRIQFLNHYRS